jgi:hypothetical protein
MNRQLFATVVASCTLVASLCSASACRAQWGKIGYVVRISESVTPDPPTANAGGYIDPGAYVNASAGACWQETFPGGQAASANASYKQNYQWYFSDPNATSIPPLCIDVYAAINGFAWAQVPLGRYSSASAKVEADGKTKQDGKSATSSGKLTFSKEDYIFIRKTFSESPSQSVVYIAVSDVQALADSVSGYDFDALFMPYVEWEGASGGAGVSYSNPFPDTPWLWA